LDLPRASSGTFYVLLIMETICFLADIKLFAVNSYVLQFLLYFIYMNLQISFAFLMTTYFSTSATATGTFLLEYSPFFLGSEKMAAGTFYLPRAVTGYLYVIGSGLIGEYLFRPFVEDTSVSSLCPAFVLYTYIYTLIYILPSFRNFNSFLQEA
jgi:hypothetical protein